MIQSKPVKPSITLLFIILNFALIAIFGKYIFLSESVWEFCRQTKGIVDPNLISFTLMNLLLVGGILMILGGLTFKHLGFTRLKHGILVFAGIWVISQITFVMVEMVAGNPLSIHTSWNEPGTSYLLGFLFAMIFGTALYEEIAFRGFILPQFYFFFDNTPIRNFWKITWAVLASSLIFSLWHIPSLVMIRGQEFPEMVFTLLGLWGAGIILSILYLRTASLYIPIAIHALNNAPTPLLENTVQPTMIVMLLGLLVIVIWPWVAPGKKKSFFYPIEKLNV